MQLLRELFAPWTWRMAWRESRTHRARLALFSLCITLGVAALVLIGSLGQSLRTAVELQAKSLLGADLVLSSRQKFPTESESWIRALGAEVARETAFSSMLLFPKTGATRLVQTRALDGPFPWYGEIEATPADAVRRFRQGDGVLVEENILIQFDAKVGDPVKLGALETTIVGSLQRVPGDSMTFATLAPRVYLAASRLADTQLLTPASLARHRALLRLPDSTPADELLRLNSTNLARWRLDVDTVSRRKTDLGNSFEQLERYLNLAAIVALLLGSIGVASAVHVYLRQKLPHVAILRCLGNSLPSTFAIYIAQGLGLASIGVVSGIVAGVGGLAFLPLLVKKLLPFPVALHPSTLAIVESTAAGFGVCLLFILLPLSRLRHISPLAAIRADFDASDSTLPPPSRDPVQWVLWSLLITALSTFAILQSRHWWEGLLFVAGLAVAFLSLLGLATLASQLLRRLQFPGLPFTLRHGLASLHRPQNRTGLLLLSLGLGVFLLVTLQLLRDTLLQRLYPPASARQPNAILFDIQPDQHASVLQLLNELNLPVLDQAPIVTMRLAAVRGQSIESILSQTNSRIPNWILRREYRSTWKSQLSDSEQIVAGEFVPRFATPDPASSSSSPGSPTFVPISLETGIAKDLGVSLGDPIEFDIQGVPMQTRVASLRKVDWRQVRPNFFVVFPEGVLEAAPSMHIVATHVTDAAASARLQREMVRRFPNVSSIDLTLVLRTLNTVIDRVGWVVRVMAFFIVATGLVVLSTTLLTGRWQRIRESILLRTLGATRHQIRSILLAEYFVLGTLAAVAGCLLAVGAGAALAHFAFETRLVISPWPLLGTLVAAPVLTVAIGMWASRGVSDAPPLEVWRSTLGVG